MSGLVSLVGAGPGDPELLTVKAARRLTEAELVLHDALVSPEILALVRGRRVDVGKRAGTKSISQDGINRRLVEAGRRGERIVRLKCGDPFVLGRGGEEALALVQAGVPFEVVPGISSALAAPALAGIPVTHRGAASGFVVVSGHDEGAYGPILSRLAPGSVTIVILMGLRSRAEIARLLAGRGWPVHTPAAVLLAASTPDTQRWRGTLGELGKARLADDGAPGTIIMGEVVAVGDRLAALHEAARTGDRTARQPAPLLAWRLTQR